MALREFYCESCRIQFEQITSSTAETADPDYGRCPRCSSAKNSRKLISRFRVGGQGDLRESTIHGCHGEKHVHGPGCGHSGGNSSD